MRSPVFIEVGHRHLCKTGHTVCGDSFICRRNTNEGRIVAVLADGLGSGIKASVLSLLTSTMLARCVSNDLDIRETARTIMATLPICTIRRIGYSTFTLMDIDPHGRAAFIEFDNPGMLWIRSGRTQTLQRQRESIATVDGRSMELLFSHAELASEDRLVMFSDGVCQAGMGNDVYPLGWTTMSVEMFCGQWLKENPRASAQELSDALTAMALKIDRGTAKDDISAAVIYLREPRKVIVCTGAPFDKRRDREIAELCGGFAGKKVVCGGTTASIIARELGRSVMLHVTGEFGEVPPPSRIPGIDLVTEGTITLSRLCTILEDNIHTAHGEDAACLLYNLLKASDDIEFIVGTRINHAHQDPSLPVNLDIRRNTIRHICSLLEQRHFKTTSVRFI